MILLFCKRTDRTSVKVLSSGSKPHQSENITNTLSLKVLIKESIWEQLIWMDCTCTWTDPSPTLDPPWTDPGLTFDQPWTDPEQKLDRPLTDSGLTLNCTWTNPWLTLHQSWTDPGSMDLGWALDSPRTNHGPTTEQSRAEPEPVWNQSR